MTHTEAVSFQPNTIYCGDCKEVLKRFPEASVDLIYLDPPFFSNRHFEVIWEDGYEQRSFEDRWKGGIQNYIAWMMERVTECYRVLKPTGSFYFHCDWHASHYLKVELDKLFGDSNFRNEIVWKRSDAHSDAKQGAKAYGRIHDTILFYTKSDDYTFNVKFNPLSASTSDKWYRHVEAETGRRYNMADLTAAKPGGDTKYEWHGVKPPAGRYWAYSKEKMAELESKELIVYSKSRKPYMKRYLDESKGVPLQDWWDDISMLRGIQKGERLGYPTQKPEALLRRILEVSANPTDIVLDPFCGCGTAIAVAHQLGMRWVGIDVSPTACKLMAKRLRGLRAKVAEVGLPRTVAQLKEIPPFEFQNWVNEKLYARPSPRKSGDMGIDGFYLDGTPIQVKQQDDVGRNVIDNFETAIKRDGKTKGVIVAFSFGKGAYEEVARVKNEEGVEILLKTVDDILNET